MSVQLDQSALDRIAKAAAEHGLLELGAVRLDHPGFEPAREALERFVTAGFHGEMQFMERTLEVRSDPAAMLEGARSVLVAAVPYRGGPGSLARYARTADYHAQMYARLEHVVEALRAERPTASSLICVDTKPLMERAAAALAGLGFVGKHGCVIVPGLGSYVLLGAVLTDAVFTGADAVTDLSKATWDACGSCRRCLEACPTDAFVAPGELDARRCISYLTIEHRGPIADDLADRMGEWVAGCDVCQEVCPYNASRKREARVDDEVWLSDPPGGVREVDLATIAGLGSSRYRVFVKGTALRRIPRRALRRNAVLALGNRSGPLDASEEAVLARALDDDDPQISAAAKRAVTRRGSKT